MEKTCEVVTPKSLEEALEQTLNGFPIQEFNFIEITRKNLVNRVFECLEDENLTVKFIGEEAVVSAGVTREFFSELFLGFSLYSTLVR